MHKMCAYIYMYAHTHCAYMRPSLRAQIANYNLAERNDGSLNRKRNSERDSSVAHREANERQAQQVRTPLHES